MPKMGRMDARPKRVRADVKKKPLARKAARRAHKAGKTGVRKRVRGY